MSEWVEKTARDVEQHKLGLHVALTEAEQRGYERGRQEMQAKAQLWSERAVVSQEALEKLRAERLAAVVPSEEEMLEARERHLEKMFGPLHDNSAQTFHYALGFINCFNWLRARLKPVDARPLVKLLGDAREVLNHGLELEHFTGGSTQGWARDVVAEIDAALAAFEGSGE